jgi:pimeloyl-ACP methyl ester carboxylesterase
VTSVLAFTEAGPESVGADASNADPLLLLHAFPLDSRMWTAQCAALADGRRVITPDLPGFGASPRLEVDPSLDAVADAVAATLDSLGIDRVVLGGLSLGGYVAMAFLRRHPGRVSALILVDTKASADAEAAAANRERIATTVVEERSLRVVLTDVLPGLVGKKTKRRRGDVLSHITDIVREAAPESIAWTQRAMAARPESFDVLKAFDAPALVVVGDEDEVTPATEASLMAKALPDARLVTIAGAGHLSAMENPDDVTKAIRDFLASLP